MAEKLWGGRFSKEIDKDFFEFQKSIHYDYKLAEYDIIHSLIHVRALRNAKILTKNETDKLSLVLKEVLKEVEENRFQPNLESEDIHTEIQNRVEKKVGKLGQKLHTLRSRNDQIAFDEKFYCWKEAELLLKLMAEVLSSVVFLSKQYKDFFIIGYTHTQRAQKVCLYDYLEAFFCMFESDTKRLTDFMEKMFIHLGSGAFKGTTLTKDYDKAIERIINVIGKDVSPKIKTVENPLEHVSDRDFIIELLSILSILQMHLSRLAEDLILFSTKEFNFVELPEEFCTGSSLMPHKKNPDFLELVRGYTGRIYGNLTALLTTMKGIPLTYNRDMQLDKEPLFSSVDIIKDELKIFAKFLKKIKFNKEAIKNALKDETLYATELAEYLVGKKVSFKEAHKIVGKLIRYSEDNGLKIKDMGNPLLSSFSPYLNKTAIDKVFDLSYKKQKK